MKQSFYNYCHKTKSGYIVYNTLYNTLVRLSESEFDYYNMKRKCNKNLEKIFCENGLWVDDDNDEAAKYIRYSYLLNKYKSTDPELTITTTMKCNARCFYCYEHSCNNSNSMSIETMNEIIKFIKALEVKDSVHINWFGGEPLLNTEIMDKFSKGLQENNINYTASIITNGSLVTDEIINRMNDLWNISVVQVTIDGTENVYYNRKQFMDNNGDYFDLLWKIKNIADTGIQVNIRINIDNDNVDDVYYLVDELETFFGQNDKISYYPAFLSGVKNPVLANEKKEIIKNIYKNVNDKRKLTILEKLYSDPKVNSCMMSNVNSFAIDVSGNIYKCERYVGNQKKSIHNLTKNSDASVLKDLLKNIDKDTNNKIRKECQRCIFLPKCMGGCNSDYENGDDPCSIDKYMIQAYLELL